MDHDYDEDGLSLELSDQFDEECSFFEHPYWTRSSWRVAVNQQDTLLGYWDWAKHQFVQDQEAKAFNPSDNGNQGA